PNTSADLIARIGRARPQPIGRPDVPRALEQALERAMSRNPEHRPRSVLELVHQLQSIESELGLVQTPIEVAMDDWALGTVSDFEDRTRVRALGPEETSTGRNRRRRRRSTSTATASVPIEHAQPSRSGSLAQPVPRSAKVLTW